MHSPATPPSDAQQFLSITAILLLSPFDENMILYHCRHRRWDNVQSAAPASELPVIALLQFSLLDFVQRAVASSFGRSDDHDRHCCSFRSEWDSADVENVEDSVADADDCD